MGRLLAIDYGLKRTGIAVTDPLRIIATALETVPTSELLKYLKNYFQREVVNEVVIGMPRQLNDKDSSIASSVRNFITLFQKHFPFMPITTWDERFTTVMAQQVLLASGKNKKARQQKGQTDRISATIILQEFMRTR